MFQKKLLFVNWISEDRLYPFVIAKKMGVEVFLATTKDCSNAIKMLIPEKNIIYTNLYDMQKLTTDVVAYQASKKISFDGVVTFNDFNVLQTSYLATLLNLPGTGIRSAQCSSVNKYIMRVTAGKNKIPIPLFGIFTDSKSGYKLLNKLTPPVVIKPVVSCSGIGCIKIETIGSLNTFSSCYEHVKRELNFHSTYETFSYLTDRNSYLMEKYITGSVVSVEAAIQNKIIYILSLSSYDMGEEPRFTQECVYMPGIVPNTAKVQSIALTKKIIKKFGFNNTVVHCELRLSQNGPVLLEIGARAAGGMMIEGYRKIGLDIAKIAINIALAKNIDNLAHHTNGYILQRAIFTDQVGMVIKIGGVEEIKKIKGVSILSSYQIGDLLFPESMGISNVFYYEVKGKSHADLLQKDKIIKNIFTITIRKNLLYRKAYVKKMLLKQFIYQ